MRMQKLLEGKVKLDVGEVSLGVLAIERFLCQACQERLGCKLTVNGSRCQRCLLPGMETGEAKIPRWAEKIYEAVDQWQR